jgi:autotransporter-associated beta strand protein
MTVSMKKIIPVAVLAALVFVNTVTAATYLKANNQTPLNQTGSWSTGVVPTSTDTGKWDATVTAANGSVSLGNNMTWAGMVLVNPGGWITFNAGNTLTLGSSGLDMSSATQNVTVNCNLALGVNQTWNVTATPTLYINGIVSGANSLTKSGAGTMMLLNVANTYQGGTTINTGTLQVGNGGGTPGEENAAALGTGTVTINSGAVLWFKPANNSNAYNVADSFLVNGGTIIGENGVQHLATGAGATFAIGASGGTIEATYSQKDVYIDGVVSGSSNLILAHGPTASGTSAGVHITNPANSFSGTIKDSSSAQDIWLNIDNNTALQYATVNLISSGAGKPTLVLNSPGTTILGGLTGSTGIVLTNTTAGTYTLNVNNAANNTFGGVLQNNTGVLALTKTGAGTLTLSGTNTYTGPTTISGGILKAGNAQALGAFTDAITVNSGGALDVNGLNLQGYTQPITINGQLDANNGAIINSGAQQMNAIGTITLVGNASVGNNGGRFDIGRGFANAINGNNHVLTKVGSNAVCILSNSSAISSILVNAGRLSQESATAFAGAPVTVISGAALSSWGNLNMANSITMTSCTLRTADGNGQNTKWSGPISLSGACVINDLTYNSVDTLSGIISGSGSLQKIGTGGGFVLSNSGNTFSGGLKVSAGTLKLAVANAIPNGANIGDDTINGTLDLNSFSQSLNGLSGAGTVTTGVAGTPILVVGNNNATSTFSGIIQNGSGTMSLTKIGTGTLTLSGNDTYSGTITVNTGTLSLTGTPTSNALKYVINGGTVSVADRYNLSASSGSLIADFMTINGGTLSTAIATGAGNNYGVNRGFIIGASGGTIEIPNTFNSNTVAILGVIAGTGALTKTGVGILNLQGANTYSGNTTISAGTLQLGAANVIPNGANKGDVTVTGTLDLNMFSDTVNGLSGAGTIDNSAAGAPKLTVGNNNATSTFSGVIKNTAGTLAITKIGSGALTLSGANTYVGATTLLAGTLLITNTCLGAGAITCNAGTLGGTGSVSGAVAINSGATFSPGVSGVGTFTVNNNLTFASGSNYAVDLGDSTCDKINVFGNVSLGGATLQLNLKSAPLPGRSFLIIDNDQSDAVSGAFNGLAEGATITATLGVTTYTFVVSYIGGTGNDVVLMPAIGPSITTQPTDQTAVALTTATFTLQASGAAPLAYKWLKNGTDSVGSSSALIIPSVPAADDKSWYQCRVKNVVDSVWSAVCTLHVITSIGSFSYSQPYISGLINTQFVNDTPHVTGYVTKYSISPPLPTGLKLDTLAGIISGTPTVQVDSLSYVVAASNGSGGNSTAGISIKVFAPAKVATPPVSQTAAVNGTAKFFVVANGSKPYSYTWMAQTIPPAAIGSGSDTLTVTVNDTTINNTRYKCIVQNVFQNNSYFDTSKACTLHVVLPPKIAQQPASQTVPKGNQAVFSVVAGGGTLPFTYAWIKNGADTAGAANSLTLTSVAANDDKSVFQCIVRNPSGAAISVPCTLHVVRAAFSGSPQTGLDSLTVAFIDSSTGGVSTWQWNFGDGTTAGTVKNPTHKYTAPGSYTVKLKVLAGVVPDSVIAANFIVVSYSKPKPAFSGTPLTARDSITVHFTDLSTGAVTARQWTFGDSTSPDTAKNPSHTFTQPGSYTVMLKITGPGGVDSTTRAAYVYVYSRLDNPTRLSGRRLSSTQVELTFNNYDSIPTSKTTAIAPWSDSLGLYFRKDSLPSNAQTGIALQTINITALQAAAKPFKDTVSVQASSPADSVFYGFSTALNWNDGTKSVIMGGNGTLVLMKDTVRTSNGIVISGKYLGVDTAAVYLDNVSLIDTGKADSVAVWYGLRDSSNFSDASSTKWFPVSALIGGAVANRFTYKIRDPRFNSDTVRAYAAVEVMGKNRMLSIEKDTSFMVGRVRPINPIRLKAKAISPSVIRLTWNKISGFDRIRIWKGLKAVPAGPDNIPAAQFDTLSPAVTDTTISATGLTEKHWYYFGAQVLQNGLWSKVTDSASARDSTPASIDTSSIKNTIKIVKFTYDTTRNALFLTWRVDMPDTNFKVGIEYSPNDFPMDPATVPTQIVTIKSTTDSAVVKLNELLTFNTKYFVSMWMGKNGKWAVPTDSSKATAITPIGTTWQVVSYFSKVHDTVYAFGGKVILANESLSDIIPTADTLRIFTPPAGALNGLVPVSIGFRFTDAADRMNVGLTVDTLLIPKGYTLADVRIYRQDSSGLYSVEYGTVFAANGTVWVLTKDLGSPFIAMVDTIAPVVKVLNSTKGAVAAGVATYDTVQIVDNIANASWIFRYAKGENSYLPGDSLFGVLGKLIDTVIVRTPALAVSSGAGVRAIFVASDAVRFDTADVSRQVLRDSTANTISTVEMKWTPLWVTARLADSTAKTALKDLGGKNGWVYDNTKFRLFRWLSYDVNSGSDDKWVEFADSSAWMFDFRPGSLFWIKTKTHTVLQLGSGVTTDLKQPSTIVLGPQAMSDVSVPYYFSVRVGDIIESTDADPKIPGRGDSLQYYRFNIDNTGHYYLTPLYVGDWKKTAPQYMNKADSATGYFCVFNPFNEKVTLRIPSIPTSMSKHTSGLSKKGQTPEGWSVQVVGHTAGGSVLSPVYCGHSEGSAAGIKFYPAMPRIDGAGISVCDQKMRHWGHEMAQGMCAKDGGVTYLLAFNGNNNTAENITFHVENLDVLPAGFKAVIMDPATDTMAVASAQLHVTVDISAGSSFRKLVIGNDSYIAKAKAANRFFRLALVGVGPNPFGRMLRIRYSLPYDGIGRVDFSIVDLRGRMVWASQGATIAGLRELVWNGTSAGKRPVASGMYVLFMKALDTKGKTAGVFEKRITYLP